MPRFNEKQESTIRTVNRAGGEAFVESPKLAFASLLLTSFVQDQFYRSAQDTLGEVSSLVPQVGPEFAAKAAIFARKEFGLRSITHATAVEVARAGRGLPWVARFVDQLVSRVDDMTEMAAYHLTNYKGTANDLPHNLANGLRRGFNHFDGYQLAKYRGEGNAVSLIDLVRLVHPKATDKNREALNKLVHGELTAEGSTWEAKLSTAGQADTKEEVEEQKAQAWGELLEENKLGYLALLRNLRNIMKQAPESLGLALSQLVDTERIHKAKVFPFQYLVAALVIAQEPGSDRVIAQLERAMEISVDNVPVLPGRTLIVQDTSGSMGGHGGFGLARRNSGSQGKQEHSPAIKAAVLSAVLLKRAEDADLMTFDTDARYEHAVTPRDSIRTIAEHLVKATGGTNFRDIFPTANRAYDRVIILSDTQGWMGYYTPTQELAAYVKRFGVQPHVFSLDIAGYGTLMFPEHQVYALAGFSEKIFDVMKLLEEDRNALVHKIEAVPLRVV